ncbi:hypothetical protein EV363DRAFT_1177291 [Boletus edulis]|nr:hypothetical protein EV363DRAFT_1177291 [Boletus edulis]
MQPGELLVADRVRAELNQFASMIWGKSQAVRRPHPAGFEYIHLEGYRFGFRALLGPAIEEEKILIRDEYRIALQTLQTDAYKRGAYVTGHPGIGKYCAASGVQ